MILLVSFLFSTTAFLVSLSFMITLQQKQTEETRLRQAIAKPILTAKKESSTSAAVLFFEKELKKRKQKTLFTAACLFATLPLTLTWHSIEPERAFILQMLLSMAAVLILQRLFISYKEIKRRLAMEEELPATLDLLLVCIEAGMSFNAALIRVASEVKGSPLAYELRMTFHELNAGVALEHAFNHMAERTKVLDIRTLSTSIIQSQKLGISLSDTLRNQAYVLRETLRSRTKEKIMKVPIKMIIPLAIFILPTLFIVVGAPAYIQIQGAKIGKPELTNATP